MEVQILRDDLHNSIMRLSEDEIETGHFYVQVLDALKDLSVSLNNIAKPIYSHINNHRPPLHQGQKSELTEFNQQATNFFNLALSLLKNQRDYEIDLVMGQHRNLLKRIKNLNKTQIKMIRREEIGTKISVVYLNTMSESKNLFLHTVNLVKSHRDFLGNSK